MPDLRMDFDLAKHMGHFQQMVLRMDCSQKDCWRAALRGSLFWIG
jgi:hypothetical protein